MSGGLGSYYTQLACKRVEWLCESRGETRVDRIEDGNVTSNMMGMERRVELWAKTLHCDTWSRVLLSGLG